jgi:hypothetical protein
MPVEYWVSFDNAASNNDLRCYLQDLDHPNKDDVACSPIARNGSTFHKAPAVSGVLCWGASPWCKSAHDFYTRVDTPQAASFLSCVMAANSATEICKCGIENKIELCD